MTYENCLKYAEEATDPKIKKFWEERIKRKYPQEVQEEEPKPKMTKKKVKEDGDN